MSNKEKILKLLKGNKLTVKEIANKTDFNENEVRTYIHRLIKDNLVKTVGKDSRWVNYTAIQKENNIESHTLDTKILKKMIKPFVEYGIKTKLEVNEIKRIKELYEVIKRA